MKSPSTSSPSAARSSGQVRRRSASDVRQINRAFLRLCRERDFRVVLACCVVLGLMSSFVMPFMSLFCTQAVQLSLAQFGVFMTVSTGFSIGISTLLSQRSDTHYSRRALLLFGSACGSVGYLGYAFSRDVWFLLAVGSLLLGTASVTFSQLFAHARELVVRSELPALDAPLYMSTFRMSFALAWTVGPALAAATLHAYSFRGLFCGAALLYLVFFVLVLSFVRTREPIVLTAKAPGLGLSATLSAPGVLGWFLAFALVFAAHVISFSNMSLFVLKVLGGTESNVGTIFSLAPLFELPLMLYLGLLATRVDPARLIRAAFALAIVYYATLSCVRSPWHIYPLQMLSAAIVAVTSGVAITFFQNKLPEKLGAATNLYANASRVGTTSGYLVFGAVASSFGHRGAYVACAGLVTVAFALSALVERRALLPGRVP